MSDQLAVSELWPLSDEEAAQKIGAFLRELQIERRTGGTSQLQADEMLYLVRESLWRPSEEKELLDHFGRCPVCQGDQPIWIHVNCDHYVACQEHKLAWYVGSNLISAWQELTPEQWEANRIMLQKEYRMVEPIYWIEKPSPVDSDEQEQAWPEEILSL